MSILQRTNTSQNETFFTYCNEFDATGLLLNATLELPDGYTVEWESTNPAAFHVVSVSGRTCVVGYGPQIGAGALISRLKNPSNVVVNTQTRDIEVGPTLPLHYTIDPPLSENE